jgi:hypothetical protein
MAKLGSFLKDAGAFLLLCIVFPALIAPSAGIAALAPVAFWLVSVWIRRTMPANGPAVQLAMTPEERHLLKTWVLFLLVPAYLISLQLWGRLLLQAHGLGSILSAR